HAANLRVEHLPELRRPSARLTAENGPERGTLLLVRAFVEEHRGVRIGVGTCPGVAGEGAEHQDVQTIEPHVTEAAFPDVPDQHTLTVAVGRGLGERAGARYGALAHVEPVAGQAPTGIGGDVIGHLASLLPSPRGLTRSGRDRAPSSPRPTRRGGLPSSLHPRHPTREPPPSGGSGDAGGHETRAGRPPRRRRRTPLPVTACRGRCGAVGADGGRFVHAWKPRKYMARLGGTDEGGNGPGDLVRPP